MEGVENYPRSKTPSIALLHLRIDRNFCSVHDMQGCVQPDWGYFEWSEQIISINTYKLIQNFFCYDIWKYIYFFKIRQIIGNKLKKNPKGFKENHTTTTARDALRTTYIFRIGTL